MSRSILFARLTVLAVVLASLAVALGDLPWGPN
jgi:hypothetical protein